MIAKDKSDLAAQARSEWIRAQQNAIKWMYQQVWGSSSNPVCNLQILVDAQAMYSAQIARADQVFTERMEQIERMEE